MHIDPDDTCANGGAHCSCWYEYDDCCECGSQRDDDFEDYDWDEDDDDAEC